MPPGVVIIPGLQKASSLFRMFLSYLFVSNELPDPVLPYLGFVANACCASWDSASLDTHLGLQAALPHL